MHSINLGSGTRIRLRKDGAIVALPSGAVVRSRPQHTPEQADSAERLGYGADVGAMCRDHDPLHALLCDWLGLPVSYSLSEAAGQPINAELARYEEAAVLAVQTFMRRSGGRLPAGGLRAQGPNA